MTLSFIFWAFYRFPGGTAFALCGKTIASLRRNILTPMLPLLREAGFTCTEKVSRNLVILRRGETEQQFFDRQADPQFILSFYSSCFQRIFQKRRAGVDIFST